MGQSLIPVHLLIVGIHLWRLKGWVWASVAALVVVLDLIDALLSTDARASATALLSSAPNVPRAVRTALFVGIIVKIGLVMLVLNGARGAFALRNVDKLTPAGRRFRLIRANVRNQDTDYSG